ncbi:MAG: M50 family metallopeptidase [Chloroflexi bacterium]|nr:M50 family metallopeptidase [Chloroflexota bacterium]
MRVHVHLSWLAAVAVFFWPLATRFFPDRFPASSAPAVVAAAAATTALFFLCVLLHELAHSAVARAAGSPTESITLYFYGGLAALKRDLATPAGELAVAAAGPLTSAVLAGGFYGLSQALAPVAPTAAAATEYLAWANGALAVFNLAPGYPLDGARVLHAILWRLRRRPEWATRATELVGQGLAYVLMIGGLVGVLRGLGPAGLVLMLLGWSLLGSARRRR